jgi:5-methyltetrahydrofolate--homocysteine methyltransferase
MSQSPAARQLDDLVAAILAGRRSEAVALINSLLELAVPPQLVVDTMIGAMDEIGRQFQCQEIFIPQMLMASLAVGDGLAVLEPTLLAAGVKPEHRAIIGTVAGDVHNIGKNLVAMMWKGAGFEVIDLGTNVTSDKFLQAAEEHQPHLIGMSSLLTTTMPAVQATVAALRPYQEKGVRVMVGGAPITQEFADVVGADGYAPDAASAVDVARRLMV